MNKTTALLTRKSPAKSAAPRGIDGDVGRVLLDIQGKVQRKLARWARRNSAEAVNDAVSYAMVQTVENLANLAADPELSHLSQEARLEGFMLAAAESELSRTRARLSRTLSLDAPIGGENEDESLTLLGCVAYRRDTPSHIEDHADAMSIARAADTMCARDRQILLTLADGLTAEEAAKELKITPGEVRLERHRIISRIQEVKGRV